MWPQKECLKGVTEIQPEVLNFGFNDKNKRISFKGTMACIAIYEKAMSPSEISLMKDTCP